MMRRGDLVTIADGSGDYTRKPRPALVVQADILGTDASVIVAPMTSQDSGPSDFRVSVSPGDGLPLRGTSHIQADKVTTVRRARVGPVFGRVPPETMRAVDRALLLALGLA